MSDRGSETNSATVVDINAKRKPRRRKAHIDLSAIDLDSHAEVPPMRALDYARTHDMSENDNVRTALQLLNREAAIVSIGASVRVAVETVASEPTVIGGHRLPSHAGRWRFLKRADFIALYEGIQVVVDIDGTVRTMTLADAWLRNPQRRQFDRVIFEPSSDSPGVLNLWRGWGVEPRPGDWSRLRAHLLDNICGGDRSLFKWTLDWLADLFQFSHRKPGTALVFKGEKGTGKTKVAEWLGYVSGSAVIVDKPEHLTGNFNAHLADKILIVADEATWGGTKHAVGALNTLITSSTLTAERKGVDAEEMRSVHRVIIIGNSNWIVPATKDERRYAVYDVGSGRQQDRQYFAALDEQMANGGAAAMLHDLLTRQITHDVGSAPRTGALEYQIAEGLTALDRLFVRLAVDGVLLDRQGNPVVTLKHDVSAEADKAKFHALIRDALGRDPSPRQFGELLSGTGINTHRPRTNNGSGLRPRMLTFPPADEFAARVEAHFGGVPLVTLSGDT